MLKEQMTAGKLSFLGRIDISQMVLALTQSAP
jgi:hypothetical protein